MVLNGAEELAPSTLLTTELMPADGFAIEEQNGDVPDFIFSSYHDLDDEMDDDYDDEDEDDYDDGLDEEDDDDDDEDEVRQIAVLFFNGKSVRRHQLCC